MRRRQFTRLVGAGIATAGLAGHVSAREDGELPNDNVSTARVNPLGSTADSPAAVASGEWITHYIGWLDAEGDESTAEDVQRWLDEVEFSVSIHGEPVEDVDQYWGDIHYDPELEAYVVWWEYSIPPQESGTYSFTIEFHYPDGFYDDGEEVRAPGTSNRFEGYYEVSGGNGKR